MCQTFLYILMQAMNRVAICLSPSPILRRFFSHSFNRTHSPVGLDLSSQFVSDLFPHSFQLILRSVSTYPLIVYGNSCATHPKQNVCGGEGEKDPIHSRSSAPAISSRDVNHAKQSSQQHEIFSYVTRMLRIPLHDRTALS